MPREITIDGLYVDDTNHPADYQGIYFFTDPDGRATLDEDSGRAAERPFPYERCQKMTVRGITTASGMKPHISANAELEQGILVIEQT